MLVTCCCLIWGRAWSGWSAHSGMRCLVLPRLALGQHCYHCPTTLQCSLPILPTRPPPALIPSATATVEILSLQREASSMPDWAAYKAHMDMGFRLSGKQR